MATPCDLPDLTESRAPNAELSNDTKQRIIGRFAAGQSRTNIAPAEHLESRLVSKIIQKAIIHGTTQNRPRFGRPKLYDARTARRAVLAARKHPKWTYEQVKEDTGLNLHPHTPWTIF